MIPLKYNFRSLFVRKGTTLMTVGSIAFVVLVYVGVLSLVGGLDRAFSKTGDDRTILVLRDGARSETESGYATETHRILAALPDVARGADGEVLASGETVHLTILKRRDGSESNVVVRGVEAEAFALRPQLQIVEGRRFEPGKAELIVGDRIASRYEGLALGDEISLGRIKFQVVGIFDAAGGTVSSEVWGAAADLGDAFRRSNYFSSSRLRATSVEAVPELVKTIKADQRLRVDAIPEPEYYERQKEGSSSQAILVLGHVLAALMAFGACFAAANTMYAQVEVRGREIGTLRALGFKRGQILGAFLIEALLLGLLAGSVGVVLSLPLNGVSAGTMNGLSFSEVVFSLRTPPVVLSLGVLLATLTGLLGGLLPAWSAARQRITHLLREG